MELDYKFNAIYICAIIILLIISYIIYKSFKNLESQLIESYKSLENKVKKLENDFNFHKSFYIGYEELKNKKFEQNEIKNIYQNNYLLLSFSNKISYSITFIRIVIFKKIVNCLLFNIIEKNKNDLKKTTLKYTDVLKPSDNCKPFELIYCSSEDINGIKKKFVNIIIDFLMFIKDYSNSKINLNKIEKPEGIVNSIFKNNKDDNSDISKKKTASIIKGNDAVEYIFNNFDFKNETNGIIETMQIKEKKANENNIGIKDKKIKNKKGEQNDEQRDKNYIKNNEEKEKMFELFKEKYITNNKYNIKLKVEDINAIKQIFLEQNKNELNTNKLIGLYSSNSNDIEKLKDESERYKKAIDDFEFNISEEYSIEKIYEIYKLQFNQNSIIYEGKDVEKHYRFTESYKKIIDIDEINKNDFLETVKDSIKQITGNHYIELISEDKGKIGNNLKIQDI